MKFVKIAAAAAVINMIGATAMAQDSGGYFGFGADAFDFDIYGVSARVGYDFSEYFGLEGQVGTSIIPDDDFPGGIQTELSIDLYAAGFLTGKFPVSERFSIVGRGGYYFADVTAEVGLVEVSADSDSFAVGIGGEYNVGGDMKSSIRLEYTYLDGEDVGGVSGGSLDTVSLAYIRRF